jgi:hypothetical protein
MDRYVILFLSYFLEETVTVSLLLWTYDATVFHILNVNCNKLVQNNEISTCDINVCYHSCFPLELLEI